MISQDDVEMALVDVRKAYRLLVLYQRRVRDLCGVILNALNENLTEPVIFRYWSPSIYRKPPQGTTDPIVNQWSWYFLPLYDFCIFYRPEGQYGENHNPGDWMFVIRIEADSGYEHGRAEPEPLQFKLSPSGSGTLVSIYAYVCVESSQMEWIELFWKNEFPSTLGTAELHDVGVRVQGMTVPLSGMLEGGSVQEWVRTFRDKGKAAFPEKIVW